MPYYAAALVLFGCVAAFLFGYERGYSSGVTKMIDRFRDGIAWQEEQEAAKEAGDMTRAKIIGKANW